jgi:hypothetical protein
MASPRSIFALDQAMMFLSLANVLHDGVLWKAVAADPHIQRAGGRFRTTRRSTTRFSLLYAERDALPVDPKSHRSPEMT